MSLRRSNPVGIAHIMLFTRWPEAGKVKTRLIPDIGVKAATELMVEMGAHVGEMVAAARILTLSGSKATALRGEVTAEGWIAGGHIAEAEAWLNLPCTRQDEGTLGDRLKAGIASAFARGAEVAAVVGGDCPELTAILINRALISARNAQGGALITAKDGGYCLLALHQNTAPHLDAIFADIDWSTEKVAAQQCDRIEAAGFACARIAEVSDVDRLEDLEVWADVKLRVSKRIASVSIIVPTLNEEAILAENLRAMHAYVTDALAEYTEEQSDVVPAAPPIVEIIVADGGSTDGTLLIAEAEGARVVRSKAGRAAQMNAGAAASTADALFFLHADTTPTRRTNRTAQVSAGARARRNPFILLNSDTSTVDVVALSFGFARECATLREKLTLSIFEFFTRMRPHWGGFPYGDQGYLCRRAYFEDLGGFPELEILEDFEFARRTRTLGKTRLRISKDIARTSPRRYLENGPVKTMWAHAKIVCAYLRGTPAAELAALRPSSGSAYSKR